MSAGPGIGGAVKESELPRELNRANNLTSDLGMLVEQLYARLKPVLRSEADEPKNPSLKTAGLNSTDIGRTISGISDKVYDVNEGLRKILSRLEI